MVARLNRNTPLPSAEQPRVQESAVQRAFDLLYVPLREVVKFLQPFAQPEKWKLLTYQSTWSDYPATSSFLRCAYKKDPLGRVRVRGLTQRSGGAQTVIAVLPQGYRPSLIAVFFTYTSVGGARLDVYPDGRIIYSGAAGAVDISLDCISFDTED